MARDLIQTYRGLKVNLPTLAQGEMGYTLDTKELFIGGSSGNDKVNNLSGVVDVTGFGAIGDGVTDDTLAIQNAILSGNVIHFPNKTYKVSDELLFRHGQSIFAPNGVKFDGTGFVGSSGDSVIKITNTGDNYTTLPLLTQDVVKDTQDLIFDTPHGLVIGDVVCLYDNTDYSWSSARTYYKKSEYAKVAVVISSTEVLMDSAFYDNYNATTNANFSISKMNMGEFSVIGDVEVIQDKTGSYYGISIERLKDFTITNLKASALNGSYTAILFRECFNTNLLNVVGIQEVLSGVGGDYGLSVANCQHFKANGYFSASRHGITTGGFDGIGAVICRDFNMRGTVKTTNEGSVKALSYHGNCEDMLWEGVVYGGINLSGKNTITRGIVYGENRGVCVSFGDVASFDHDLSGIKLYTSKDSFSLSSGRGIIDLGGAGSVENDGMLNGTLNLSNISIHAPNGTRGVVIRSRNPNTSLIGTKNINLSNANIQCKEGNTNTIAISNTGGNKDFDTVNLTGLQMNDSDGGKVVNTNTVLLPIQKGEVSVTLAPTFIASSAVNFDKPFPNGQVPTVTVSGLENNILGGNSIITNVSSVDEDGFKLSLTLNDGSNFLTTDVKNFKWEAK